MKRLLDKYLLDWIDSRTGYRRFVKEMLFEHIPGGARWRYVWGSTLVFTFVVQMVTGVFLWMAYSPSAQTAWESVAYIQHEMQGGWLLRGIHHYTAQIMVVLLTLHVLQVVIDGAYRAPREFNFFTGLILLFITLALGLTGYLLPWDQKGYWATRVATNLIGVTPLAGEELQRLVVGGADYGHHSLTRFFALHAGVLPGLMIAFIGLHVYLFRRQGIHAKEPRRRPDAYFWPDQVLRDGIACLAVFAVVLLLIFQHRMTGGDSAMLGASLMAPADPSQPYAAARPDWYFLSLFQLLKYFKGPAKIWGVIYIPGIVVLVMALMPFLGRWKLGHRFNVVFLCAVLVSAGTLTGLALLEDSRSEDYIRGVAQAERNAERVWELAQGPEGIPPEGAVTLLREDPLTRGPELFADYCASCHTYGGHDGTGRKPEEEPTASDLQGFASRKWLAGFLDPEKIATQRYFGGTAFADGRMVGFVEETVAWYDEEEQAMLAKVIKALSAEAKLKSQRELDAKDAKDIAAGKGLMDRKYEGESALNCLRCHEFYADGRARGPDLTGYGSREWLLEFVMDPSHERFYGDDNDRMPAFREVLDRRSLELIVDWLRGEWFVLGEEPAAVPPAGQRVKSAASATPATPDADPPEATQAEPGEEPEEEEEGNPRRSR